MKYRLLHDDTIECEGRTCYRIQCVTPFADVKAGDLGGYIESEHNLSGEGACWVYDNAVVCEQARVRGGASVRGNALVCGSADISGHARVFDNTRVGGGTRITQVARVFGNAVVEGTSFIGGSARLYDEAHVDNSRLRQKCEVFGRANLNHAVCRTAAKVYDYAAVVGKPEDPAIIAGGAHVYGHARVVSGCVDGDARVFEHAEVYGGVAGHSRVYGHAIVPPIVFVGADNNASNINADFFSAGHIAVAYSPAAGEQPLVVYRNAEGRAAYYSREPLREVASDDLDDFCEKLSNGITDNELDIGAVREICTALAKTLKLGD